MDEDTMAMEEDLPTGADENDGFGPVFASFLYGVIASTEAALPLAMILTIKSLDLIDRNDIYKWAWYIMAWGGVGIYGPVAILWPLSYIGLGDLYVSLADILGWLGFLMHLTVSFMFWWAANNYLYEADLSYTWLWVEELAYNFTIYIVFYMSKRSLMNEYYHFYST